MKNNNQVFLSVGTNIGDRKQNLENAIFSLQKRGFLIEFVSSTYESLPWGKTNQALFYNIVIQGSYLGTPKQLLANIHEIEDSMGRVRNEMWGPRVIDIDILLFSDIILNDEMLIIPHPRMGERAFVLVPFAEIAPNTKLPKKSIDIKVLLENLSESEVLSVKKISNHSI